MIINLISSKNGVGLEKDVYTIGGLLSEMGHQVYFIPFKNGKEKKADINIFLEIVEPRFFKCAPINYLVPNPEWFYPQWKPYLRKFDKILCKTHHAVDIFSGMGFPCKYIGWTSEDKYDPSYKKSFNKFFHLAGKSSMKGTNRIIKCWKEHYPELVIVQDPRQPAPEGVDKPNITYIHERLSEEKLSEFMNSIGIHLCMSEAEGFGHYIWEALSCGNLVITTDAPPMNEIDEIDSVFTVDWLLSETEKLSTRYFFEKRDFQGEIESCIMVDDDTLSHLNQYSRPYWEENKLKFESNIKELFQ